MPSEDGLLRTETCKGIYKHNLITLGGVNEVILTAGTQQLQFERFHRSLPHITERQLIDVRATEIRRKYNSKRM
jgi:hypothetical protein